MTPLLALDALSVSIVGTGLALLDAVSFTLDDGETVALVGESGSGKTSLALALMGLLPSGVRAGGDVVFEGRRLFALGDAERRGLRGRRMAMVFQEPFTALNPRQRVGRAVAEVALAHGERDARKAMDAAVTMMERLGIHDAAARAARYPHQLSGGERQRVLLAMALLLSPALLIADEPTSALDVTVQAQVLELLRERQRESGMALLLITHDLSVVAGTCARTLVLHAGRLVEDAPTRQLFTSPSHPTSAALVRAVARAPRAEPPAGGWA